MKLKICMLAFLCSMASAQEANAPYLAESIYTIVDEHPADNTYLREVLSHIPFQDRIKIFAYLVAEDGNIESSIGDAIAGFNVRPPEKQAQMVASSMASADAINYSLDPLAAGEPKVVQSSGYEKLVMPVELFNGFEHSIVAASFVFKVSVDGVKHPYEARMDIVDFDPPIKSRETFQINVESYITTIAERKVIKQPASVEKNSHQTFTATA